MFGRNKLAMIGAEFLGTAILTMVVLAVAYSPVGYPSYFVAGAAALVLIAMTLVFGRVSGAQLNPAITIGMWSARLVKTLPAVIYVAAQLLGALAAYSLYTYFVKTANFPPVGKYNSHILVAEAVGAFVFSLGWAAASYQRLKLPKAASAVGVSLFLGIMVASIASMGLLNPAVALGVKSWVWGTYVLGPVLGAIIGFNLYALLFAPKEVLIEEGAEIIEETVTVEATRPSRTAKSSKKSKK